MNTSTKLFFAAAIVASFLTGCTKDIPVITEASISGKVACAKDDTQGLSDVKVEILQNGKVLQTVTTNAKGEYLFQDLTAGGDYTLNLRKDETFNVSTFDLVLLNKAILGLPTTASVFQQIAADVDLSGVINTTDITLLRSVILDISKPDVKVWRFATKDFEFPSPKKPLGKGAINSLSISNLMENNTVIDFVPVKLGDIELKATCK
jgi:SdrD B-like domain